MNFPFSVVGCLDGSNLFCFVLFKKHLKLNWACGDENRTSQIAQRERDIDQAIPCRNKHFGFGKLAINIFKSGK